MQKDTVMEVNKLYFKFIWKGKDEVKRLSLIGDSDKGGLKAPHLESMIKSQRIMCCKKFAKNQQSNWKIIPPFPSSEERRIGIYFALRV